MIGVSLRVLIVPVTVVGLTRAAPTLATGGRLFSPDLFLLQYNKTYDKSCISSYSFKWKYLMNGGTVWALTCCALKLSFPPWVEFIMLIPGLTIEEDNVAKFSLPKNLYQHTNSKYFCGLPSQSLSGVSEVEQGRAGCARTSCCLNSCYRNQPHSALLLSALTMLLFRNSEYLLQSV